MTSRYSTAAEGRGVVRNLRGTRNQYRRQLRRSRRQIRSELGGRAVKRFTRNARRVRSNARTASRLRGGSLTEGRRRTSTRRRRR